MNQSPRGVPAWGGASGSSTVADDMSIPALVERNGSSAPAEWEAEAAPAARGRAEGSSAPTNAAAPGVPGPGGEVGGRDSSESTTVGTAPRGAWRWRGAGACPPADAGGTGGVARRPPPPPPPPPPPTLPRPTPRPTNDGARVGGCAGGMARILPAPHALSPPLPAAQAEFRERVGGADVGEWVEERATDAP